MSVRTRILTFSSGILVAFGIVFAIGYVQVVSTILPRLESHVRERAKSEASSLAQQLDVVLGADDRRALAAIADAIAAQEDFRGLEVRDDKNNVLAVRGQPMPDAMGGDALTPIDADGEPYIRAWTKVEFEGVTLGRVSVAYSTERVEELGAWTHRVAVIAVVVWILAFIFAQLFARSLIQPFRAMTDFSRRVANGGFGEQLAIEGPSEMKNLAKDLNAMSAQLATRAAKNESMQKELLEVSRLAGMAEVATGVLHNVGNVLNSLNVSITLVGDRLAASKVPALAKTVALYETHPGGLQGLLATGKGTALPAYLSGVSKQLTDDLSTLRSEVTSVASHVEHIKTIVAMQQTHARAGGVEEQVDVAELVTDAIRFGELSFQRHGVEIERDYDSVPKLVADRHKVLQILINLISNARHAVIGFAQAPKIVIRLRREDDTLVLSIIDNGCGISEENAAKIFRHGFTTKPGGHGFGLHASANAARELGGSVDMHSDGVGKGATFTVRIPLKGTANDLTN